MLRLLVGFTTPTAPSTHPQMDRHKHVRHRRIAVDRARCAVAPCATCAKAPQCRRASGSQRCQSRHQLNPWER